MDLKINSIQSRQGRELFLFLQKDKINFLSVWRKNKIPFLFKNASFTKTEKEYP